MGDLKDYWLWRGEKYCHEPHLRHPRYRDQERFIVDTVKAFEPKKILEIGCGFGRVTRCLAEAMPECRILGVDISPAQINNAHVHCCLHANAEFTEDATFRPRVDMVCAFEVLLHVPPDELQDMIAGIFKAAPVFIHDFDRDPSGDPGRHVFNHDYPAVYAAMGLKFETRESGPHSLMVVRK